MMPINGSCKLTNHLYFLFNYTNIVRLHISHRSFINPIGSEIGPEAACTNHDIEEKKAEMRKPEKHLFQWKS